MDGRTRVNTLACVCLSCLFSLFLSCLWQPGRDLCLRLREMLGHLSLAVHPHLPPTGFHLPHEKGPWRGPRPCKTSPLPSHLYFPRGLTSSSLSSFCWPSPCPPGRPLSTLSPLSWLFLGWGSASPSPSFPTCNSLFDPPDVFLLLSPMFFLRGSSEAIPLGDHLLSLTVPPCTF